MVFNTLLVGVSKPRIPINDRMPNAEYAQLVTSREILERTQP